MSSRKRLHDQEEEEEECDPELQRASEIVEATSKLVERLETKYGTQVGDLTDQIYEAKEKLVRTAVMAWLSRNFKRAKDDSDEEEEQDGSGASGISKSRLRDCLNEYLARLGLPHITKKGNTWTKYVLKDLVGLEDRSLKSGKKLPLRDVRSLENFEQTLMDLLQTVRREREVCPWVK